VVRLTRVDVTYNSALVRRYHIAYESALSNTGRSRVQSIQECAGASGTDCLPATTFAYQSGTPGLANEVSSGVSLPTTAPLPLDVNGDGLSDIVYSSSTTSGSGVWMVMFANTGGTFNAPVNTGITNTNYSQAIRIDYDADGLEDFLVPYSGGTWWVVRGTPTGLASPVNTGVAATGAGGNARAMDVNGDGLDDLVYAIVTGSTHSVQARLRVWGGGFAAATYLYGPVTSPVKIIGPVFGFGPFASRRGAPDFNGDGLVDFLVHIQEVDGGATFHSWETVLSGGAGVTFISNAATVGGPYWPDLNGDGCSDAVYTRAYFWRYRISNCYTLGPELTGPATSMLTETGSVVYDWDSDGYDDIVGFSSTTFTWHYIRSSGQGLSAIVDSGISSASPISMLGDVNGDGLDDIVYRNSSGVLAYRPHAGVTPDLLTSVTDAYGNVSGFAYGSTAQGNYTKYADAVFPEQDTAGPFTVVHTLTLPDGSGGSYSQGYSYSGARVHRQGRGFEGFHAQRITDSRTGLRAHTQYQRAFPYTGLRSRHELRQSNDTTLISRTIDSWASYSYGTGTQTRYLPYLNQSSQDRYEFAGAYNSAQISSAVTNLTVDSGTGATTDVVSTVTETSTANGVRAGAQYTQRTYLPTLYTSTTNWCLGRPATMQQISSHNQYGGAVQTRETSVAWDGAKCRPTQTVIEPGHAQLQVTTDLGFDGFGNANSVTVTGVGMSARTTTTDWGSTGQFPVSSTNALGQASATAWNYASGVPTSATDPNGITVSWQYDDFARRTRESRPDGTATTWEYAYCSSGCNSRVRLYVIERARDTSNNVVRTDTLYLDQDDRPIYEYRQALGGAQSVTTRAYNALGLVHREYFPFWSAGPDNGYTTHVYDALGRRTSTSRPVSDSDPTLQTQYIYYEGLTTRTVDELSKQTTHVADALGQIARSIDHNGYYQSFDHDAFGNPVRVLDSLGNTLQSDTYNLRGMRTAQVDMNLGSRTFTPNALGEIVSQTNALSQTTTFQFDALGRLTQRIEPEGTSTWTWGNSAGAKNIGRLASMSGPGYTRATHLTPPAGRRARASARTRAIRWTTPITRWACCTRWPIRRARRATG
jgi:YD repeat-containing protein